MNKEQEETKDFHEINAKKGRIMKMNGKTA